MDIVLLLNCVHSGKMYNTTYFSIIKILLSSYDEHHLGDDFVIQSVNSIPRAVCST